MKRLFPHEIATGEKSQDFKRLDFSIGNYEADDCDGGEPKARQSYIPPALAGHLQGGD